MAPLTTVSAILFSAITILAAPQQSSTEANPYIAGQRSYYQGLQGAATSAAHAAISDCIASYNPSCTTWGITAPATSVSATATAPASSSGEANPYAAGQRSYYEGLQASASAQRSACISKFDPTCTAVGITAPVTPTAGASSTGLVSGTVPKEVSSATNVAGPSAAVSIAALNGVNTPAPSPYASTPGASTPTGAGAGAPAPSGSGQPLTPKSSASGFRAGAGSAALGAIGIVAAFFL